MATKRKPTVTLKCVANTYASACERIVEIFDRTTQKGCLISIRSLTTGELLINVYRADLGVIVKGPTMKGPTC